MTIAGRIGRPGVLAAIFGAYFGVVMFAAWSFASHSTVPWFGPDLTRWVYMTHILASTVFLAGLALLAFHVQNVFETRVSEINRQLGSIIWSGVVSSGGVEAPPPGRKAEPDVEDEDGDPTQRDLDEMLEVLGEAQAETAQEVLLESADSTVEQADPVEAAREIMLRRDLVRRREGLKRHQDSLVRFLPGPAGLAAGILGVSMAMLPASDGVLQSSFQLNTALILGFAYGWFGLAAYFAASILGVVASLRSERKRRIPRVEE